MGIRVSEKSVATKIMKYLKTIPNSKFIRRPASGFGNAGEPDCTGSINGRHVELEFKGPGATPTPLQLQKLEEWRKAGAVALWADSLDTVIRELTAAGLIDPMKEAA